jgi:hypothetical protein
MSASAWAGQKVFFRNHVRGGELLIDTQRMVPPKA